MARKAKVNPEEVIPIFTPKYEIYVAALFVLYGMLFGSMLQWNTSVVPLQEHLNFSEKKYAALSVAYEDCGAGRVNASMTTLQIIDDKNMSDCVLAEFGSNIGLHCNIDNICKEDGWVPRPEGFDRSVNLTYAGNCMFCVKSFCGVVPNCTSSTPFSIVVGNETYNYSTDISTGSNPSQYRIGNDSR